MTFTELAHLVAVRRLRYDHDADLPQPNVYWGTVRTADSQVFNDYVAAAHTRPALFQLLALATVALRLKLTRANNIPQLRRLKLGDLMECPEAFEQALRNAQALGDVRTAEQLTRLPLTVAEGLGVIIDQKAAVALLAPQSASPRTLRTA